MAHMATLASTIRRHSSSVQGRLGPRRFGDLEASGLPWPNLSGTEIGTGNGRALPFRAQEVSHYGRQLLGKTAGFSN